MIASRLLRGLATTLVARRGFHDGDRRRRSSSRRERAPARGRRQQTVGSGGGKASARRVVSILNGGRCAARAKCAALVADPARARHAARRRRAASCRWRRRSHGEDIQQPTHRNMNGFMFGVYIMRRALEYGWLSAYSLEPNGRRALSGWTTSRSRSRSPWARSSNLWRASRTPRTTARFGCTKAERVSLRSDAR